MSEFKFACPVCGQHITAAAAAGGTHIECPTCFQRIVVPQAPSSLDTKLIISAKQVGGQRMIETPGADLRPIRRPSKSTISTTVFLIVLLTGSAAALYAFRHRLFPVREPVLLEQPEPPPKPTHASVANYKWTSNLAAVRIPDTPAAGAVRGHAFLHDTSSFQWGILSLREGTNWPPVRGVTVILHIKPVEEYARQTIEILPAASQGTKVVVWWRDEQQKGVSRQFTEGYSLKLNFEDATTNKIRGKLYLSLPDNERSFLTGTFNATIRKTRPGQNRGKNPPPPQQAVPTNPPSPKS